MATSHEPLVEAPPRTADAMERPTNALGAWDAVSLVVGIVVGVGIFRAPADVFLYSGGGGRSLLAWALGGALSFAGALCFAELASAYPRSGGEYVYLTKAFGPRAGFLCAWANLAVLRTGGTVAVLACVCADYFVRLCRSANPADATDLATAGTLSAAVGMIAILTIVNVLGLAPGRRSQNLLTVLKLLALGGVILVGFLGPTGAPASPAVPTVAPPSFGLALVFVLWTYSGWHEAAYVAAEVRDGRRNVPRALLLGTVAVTVIYLLVNCACLASLGYDAACRSPAFAADLLAHVLGPAAGRVMAALILVSALGALNGTIFTGARIYRELGVDHPLFAPLGVRSARLGSPVRALVLQGVLGAAMVLAVGWAVGGADPFDMLVRATAPVFWLFFLLTGVALFVLRHRGRCPPFATPGYPLTPALFCAWCGYMLIASVQSAGWSGLAGLGLLAIGLPLYELSRRLGHQGDGRGLD